MVILLDLDEDQVENNERQEESGTDGDLSAPATSEDDRSNPNINSFSATLSCYPAVLQIATHLDLNSLHNLSATCRQFRANLLQYRSQLVKHTLRCSNEDAEMRLRLVDRDKDSKQALTRHDGVQLSNRLTSGRVGRCARDMVGECRRCGIVICRNCTIKPPPPSVLKGRHRRLCKTCMKAPLRYHFQCAEGLDEVVSNESFTSEAFSRTACTCPEAVYICMSCGNALRSVDVTYSRGWTWRTRYSTYLGGLGTGIGEGNEGVECGKGDLCLAAKEVEKEIDCDAAELAELERESEKVEGEGRHWGGTSYLTQEIEGIGGIFKKKVKKRIRVGAVVKEYEDEREHGDYLRREQNGLNRSWCSWCSRVVPGHKDTAILPFQFSLNLAGGSSSSSIDLHE